jgi:uncharacterized protein
MEGPALIDSALNDPAWIRGVLAGAIAGLASGFLGVSPGGILVPVISLFLPFPQHVVQAVSLVAQAPPTSLAGISAYARRGRRIDLITVAIVSMGFVAGGPIGAAVAKRCSEHQLRWMFVGYLLVLTALAVRRRSDARKTSWEPGRVETGRPIAALVSIGVTAGFSSGFLGIGGGLAITALSVVLVHREQHEAQALSLAISALPLTLPAAWIYSHEGVRLPWPTIGGLIAGLALGSWIGARFANLLPEKKLKTAFVVLLIAMASYMAMIASRS